MKGSGGRRLRVCALPERVVAVSVCVKPAPAAAIPPCLILMGHRISLNPFLATTH